MQRLVCRDCNAKMSNVIVVQELFVVVCLVCFIKGISFEDHEATFVLLVGFIRVCYYSFSYSTFILRKLRY